MDTGEGRDRFQLQIEGVDFVFDFPNSTTLWSAELRQRVNALSGISRITVH